MGNMTLRQFLNAATARLTAAHTDAPRLAAQVLAAHALQCTRLDLALRAEDPLLPAQIAAVEALLQRREQGEPVAYIIGTREFFGRDFAVTPATLIPRPETEELVEAALRALAAPRALFADIGTGSGCIAVTLAAQRPGWQGCMLDISAAALQTANANAARHGVAQRLLAVRGDLCRLPLERGTLDLLISNPPYISADEYATLDRGVREFEPRTALTPDVTGLSHLHALALRGAEMVRAGGLCLVEHGAAQGEAVAELFANTGYWQDISTHKDMAGHDRWCQCRRSK